MRILNTLPEGATLHSLGQHPGYKALQTTRPEGATLHSPGHRPGYKKVTSNAPCKGSSNVPLFFTVALTGRVGLFVSVYPGRCPGLWRTLGFQPALAMEHWAFLLRQAAKPNATRPGYNAFTDAPEGATLHSRTQPTLGIRHL